MEVLQLELSEAKVNIEKYIQAKEASVTVMVTSGEANVAKLISEKEFQLNALAASLRASLVTSGGGSSGGFSADGVKQSRLIDMKNANVAMLKDNPAKQ